MAYKALAKKYHPDLNPGQEEAAQEKMKDTCLYFVLCAELLGGWTDDLC